MEKGKKPREQAAPGDGNRVMAEVEARVVVEEGEEEFAHLLLIPAR